MRYQRAFKLGISHTGKPSNPKGWQAESLSRQWMAPTKIIRMYNTRYTYRFGSRTLGFLRRRAIANSVLDQFFSFPIAQDSLHSPRASFPKHQRYQNTIKTIMSSRRCPRIEFNVSDEYKILDIIGIGAYGVVA